MKDISITYLGGSGFLLTTGENGFLFDPSLTGPDDRIFPTKEILSSFSSLYVFISHHHEDHFDPSIYDICPSDAHFFLGYDISDEYKGIKMKPGDEIKEENITVRACGSTDDGVSYLIHYKGLSIFHAGDLNLWHWRDESTISEIEAAEKSFYDCVSNIPKTKIDISFFPVDPRQGNMYEAGASYFIMTVKPLFMIPMHFQGRADVASRFSFSYENSVTRTPVLSFPGDKIDISIPEDEESDPQKKLIDFINENP